MAPQVIVLQQMRVHSPWSKFLKWLKNMIETLSHFWLKEIFLLGVGVAWFTCPLPRNKAHNSEF